MDQRCRRVAVARNSLVSVGFRKGGNGRREGTPFQFDQVRWRVVWVEMSQKRSNGSQKTHQLRGKVGTNVWIKILAPQNSGHSKKLNSPFLSYGLSSLEIGVR